MLLAENVKIPDPTLVREPVPEIIPENKTRIIIYIWDSRIKKAKKYKLAWFFRSTIQSMFDTRNRIKKGGSK